MLRLLVKLPILLSFLFAFSIYSEEKQSPSPISGSNPVVDSGSVKQEEKKPEFIFSQALANDVFIFGNSLYGERLSRRNNEEYQTVSNGLILGTFVNFLTPITGLKVNLVVANPLTGRSNTDNDFFYQSSPGGKDETDKVVRSVQGNQVAYDLNQIRPRKENNGLRDYFIGQIGYEWNTSIGQFSTGFFIINSNNYPTNTSAMNYTFGWKPNFLTVLKPELISNYRISSETNGLNQGNSHHRLGFSHEFDLSKDWKLTPGIQTGFQYFNNNTDRRTGVTDITTKVQVNYSFVNFSISDVYRPSLFLFDNDRTYPKPSGVSSDQNPEDGKVADPSKIHGTTNQLAAATIQSLSLDPITKDSLINSYQQQHLPKHHIIFNLGYMAKF
ncbi:hypothetical protein LPTSP3_g34820 [Leptospira kobayashii]|uniref:Outer membrane protein n=1 Tax=Leptospira kobayashii TaxID=1917830 RepID=A0ABN6KK85_9LEPT|nr:hypothetical protein [Leptospira kobayashii]BDA80552.1 hypothetical protein LPTSP3_g34820 [Leptospira kobayashii]